MCFTRLPKRIGPKAYSSPAFGFRQLRGPAAVVFEETASHKPLSSAACVLLVQCPKEPVQSNTAFKSEDYVSLK